MIDESTVTSHLVVFASLVVGRLRVPVFLRLSSISYGQKDGAIMVLKVSSFKKDWRLHLEKFVEFGSDNASTMDGKRNGVAALLKSKVNPFDLCPL